MKNPRGRISVIIPTHNGWTSLKKCIDSIFKQTLLPSEVIVVDNASTDQTLKNVKKYFPKVILVKMQRNTGVTGGRNAGILKADKGSEFLLFFDHDMVAGKEMIERLLKAAQVDKSFGILTPKIFYFSDKKRIWSAGTNINLWTGQVLFRGGKDTTQFNKLEEVQVAPAAMFVKREVINAVNEFDERYFATYEDTDFCFRAKEKGFKTVYIPEAVGYHMISPEISKSQKRLIERSFWIGRNRILFMGDYARNFYLFLLISPIYLAYFLFISLNQANFKGFSDYLRGVFSGLIEELVARRVLIHIPFSLYNSLYKLVGGGSKSVLDVGCGDGKSMSILDYKKEWKVYGVDIYKPYVDRASQRGVYEKVLIGDVLNIDKLFKGKKFDVVLISSVLDHLEKDDALSLMEKAEKLGKKVILSGLPNGYSEKHEPHFWEGDNPHQEHKSAWEISDFEKRGYRVYGFGSSLMMGHGRLSQRRIFKKSPFRIPISFFENIFAYLLSPLAFYIPRLSVGLFAVKSNK